MDILKTFLRFISYSPTLKGKNVLQNICDEMVIQYVSDYDRKKKATSLTEKLLIT